MKTAVEWLYDQIENEGKCIYEVMEQAKEMEKEQIIDAHGDKQKTKSNPNSIVTYGYTFTGKMYYDKIFKSE